MKQKMPKVYIAASFADRGKAMALAKLVRDAGMIVTSSWLDDKPGNEMDMAALESRRGECVKVARRDMLELSSSDALLLYRPKSSRGRYATGGCHVETGMALALGLPVFLVGPKEENVFHYLSQVRCFSDPAMAIKAVARVPLRSWTYGPIHT